jgi:hypothetical protein
MKVTKKINFKELRDKGANALDIKDDEVIQLDAKKGMLCIVTQEYLLKLIDIENDSKFNWVTSQKDLGAKITGSVNYLQNTDEQSSLDLGMKGFMNSIKQDQKFGARANGLNKPKILGANISELLKGNAPKKLEDRVEELENIVKDLLLNKEENNGKGKI